jgi:cytoskeletal protein RodZ
MDNFVRIDSVDNKLNSKPNKPVAPKDDEPEQKLPERPKKSSKKRSTKVAIIVAVAGVIFVGLAAFAIYQYSQAEYLKTPEGIAEIAKQDSDQLVEKVSQLIKLPDEEAVVATVDDKDKLREQPFFVDVENGDKVLIFSAASRAVIYRPSENRIINSGPIAITAEDTAAEQTTVE